MYSIQVCVRRGAVLIVSRLDGGMISDVYLLGILLAEELLL